MTSQWGLAILGIEVSWSSFSRAEGCLCAPKRTTKVCPALSTIHLPLLSTRVRSPIQFSVRPFLEICICPGLSVHILQPDPSGNLTCGSTQPSLTWALSRLGNLPKEIFLSSLPVGDYSMLFTSRLLFPVVNDNLHLFVVC